MNVASHLYESNAHNVVLVNLVVMCLPLVSRTVAGLY